MFSPNYITNHLFRYIGSDPFVFIYIVKKYIWIEYIIFSRIFAEKQFKHIVHSLYTAYVSLYAKKRPLLFKETHFIVAKVVSKTISRVMSLDGHLSSTAVASSIKQPTRKLTGRHMLSVWSCFRWGLHVPRLLPAGR